MTRRGPAAAAQLESRAAALTTRQRHVLEVISSHPGGVSVRQLGDLTGMHGNTLREHIAALERAGLVHGDAVKGPGRGRPGRVYVTQIAPPGAATTHLATLVRVLVAGDPERARARGREWARDLVAHGRFDPRARDLLGEITRLFAEMGLAPSVSAGAIDLRTCPFIEEGEPVDAALCWMHQGTLEGLAGAVSDATGRECRLDLEPMVGSTSCRIAVSRSDAESVRRGTGNSAMKETQLEGVW
ncbi:MAG: helix-turn-helix domain-containing protein [Actinomycetales bacterium]|nr:helix-turn-helix domain-containing protein [Actinomycetales bacterium]